MVRSGTSLSLLAVGSAMSASPETRRVFSHSSGGDSVEEKTSLGSAVSRWDAGSEVAAEIVASSS